MTSAGISADARGGRLQVGMPVEVHSTFSERWVGGFEVADVSPDGCRLRRLSDRSVLPSVFPSADVRPQYLADLTL
jgi:hypothetical protein